MNNKEFSRQPRFLPEMPDGEVEILSPPPKPSKPEISWALTLLPPFVMILVTVIMAMLSNSIYMFVSLAMTVTTVITSIGSGVSRKRKYKKEIKLRAKKYGQYVADIRSELSVKKNAQKKAAEETNPSPEQCITRIRNCDSKLWERTPAHDDFLSVRLGMGNVPFAVNIKYDKKKSILDDDIMLDEPEKIAKEFESVSPVPVCLDLFDSEISGVAGEESKVSYLIQLLLLQMVTNHGYDDVRIVYLAKESTVNSRMWIRFAPHLWSDDKKKRYFLCGKAMAHRALTELYDIIKLRDKDSDEDNNEHVFNTLPHYVFIVEDMQLLENEPIAKYLYNPSKKFGVSTVFTAPNKAYLPANCKAVVTVNGNVCSITNRETLETSTFTPDGVNLGELEGSARRLAGIHIKNSGKDFALPDTITLNELYSINRIEEFKLMNRWTENKPYKGMRVPIGARAGKELFYLDIHEKGFGPHGLVAGTTGSGKSELLQSVIVSLAMNYHPHDLVFVLIDYKGGGMADAFSTLPHLAGTITNLGGNQTTRALISIKSELKRRQIIFSKYGVNNIDKYQKLYHSGQADIPVPHLVMIADEFAELKAEQPEFMKELVSTARVGRSLGIHLILATQKPAGVVDDQIWSNSKFKICLKVQDVNDSKDVIKRPGAAMIKEPGRAYIQVGNDEVFEMFQSAYSGAVYAPDDELGERSLPKDIYKLSLDGRAEKIYPLNTDTTVKKDGPSQLEAMVGYIAKTAEENNIYPLPGPWMPPLEDEVTLGKVIKSDERIDFESGKYPSNATFNPPVAIFDDPAGQMQDVLKFDFVNNGNLFVYGMSGSGKTTFIKSLCMSLALTHSPEDVNMYIMDFGGTGLKRLEMLPHTGGVMSIEEEDRINTFMLFIMREIDQRKKTFTSARVDTFDDYRKKMTGHKMPAIFIVVDNYYALSESYEMIDEKMMNLAREGNKYGVYIIATAMNATLVRYRFAISFKMAVTFSMTDKTEYASVVGRTNGLEPMDIPGRGLVKNTPPLEFQTANPKFNDVSYDEILEKFEQLEKDNKLKRAKRIPQMPEIVDIFAIQGENSDILSVGVMDKDMLPCQTDVNSNHVMLIAGDMQSGKSTVVMSLISLMGSMDAKIYAKDSSDMGIYPIINMPNVIDMDEYEEKDIIAEISSELDRRRIELTEAKKRGESTDALVSSWQRIVLAFDNIAEASETMGYDMKKLIVRIAKKEAGLKVCLLAGGETETVYSQYDEMVKPFKEAQCGILLGSMKNQNLFNVRMEYGAYEKEMEKCDGYFIARGKFASIRAAVDQNLL